MKSVLITGCSSGIGATVAGAALGIVLGAFLIGMSRRRRQQDYEPDRGLCLSCGRCFDSCPRSQAPQKRPGAPPAPKQG